MLHGEPAADVMLSEGEAASHSGVTRIFLGTEQLEATGTLMITNRRAPDTTQTQTPHTRHSNAAEPANCVCVCRRVVWLPSNGQQRVQGFSLFFQAIAMHAVSRDTDDFPHPCLYVQLDPEQNISEVSDALRQGSGPASKRQRQGADGAADDLDEDEEEDIDYQEMRLVPADGADEALDAMFKAMSEGAAANPDPGDDDDDDEDDEGGGFYTNEDELLAGVSSQQLSMLERYEGMLDAQPAAGAEGRFDDAEEGEGEEPVDTELAKETGEGR